MQTKYITAHSGEQLTNYLIIFVILLLIPPQLQALPSKTKYWQTKNSVPVIFQQVMDIPSLDICIGFAAGSAFDDLQYGLSSLTTNLLNQGNAGLSANTIAEHLADTGAVYESNTNRDMVVLHLKTLSSPKIMQQAIATFAKIVSEPDFTEIDFQREKNKQLLRIVQAEGSPNETANQVFFKTLYQNHPYAHPINGTQASLNSINAQHPRNFYKRYFVASNAYIVLVGAIEQKQARKVAEQLTKGLVTGKTSPKLTKAQTHRNTPIIVNDFQSTQTAIRLGQLGITHQDKNYFPLLVGNYILGGASLTSRLNYEIREKRGLTYNINSQFISMSAIGPFIISLATQNKQASIALKVTKAILTKFITFGVSNTELMAAIRYLSGNFPLSLASNEDRANILLRIAFYHLPKNYLQTYISNINAVTTAEITSSFQNLIDKNNLLLVVIGKA